jgi:hypothetical protein
MLHENISEAAGLELLILQATMLAIDESKEQKVL